MRNLLKGGLWLVPVILLASAAVFGFNHLNSNELSDLAYCVILLVAAIAAVIFILNEN